MASISVETARDILLSNVCTQQSEYRPLAECIGRVLAAPLCASINQPPFRRSAMDGYAVKSEDLGGADREKPVALKVIYKTFAGDEGGRELCSGEAVRLMTGAIVPEGADCVVRQEDTDEGEDVVEIYTSLKSGDNVSPIGEDFKLGDMFCPAGTRVDPYVMSCAAASGSSELCVMKKLRVGLILTGSELTRPGEALLPGKIYNSSEAFLTGRLIQLGCELSECLYVDDVTEKIKDALYKMSQNSDFIISTGGVSVGQKDLLQQCLEELSAEILFHGIAIKPGMPTMASLLNDIPVLSLSGNPYSAAAIFELLFKPALHKMLGLNEPAFVKAKAVLAQDLSHGKKGRRIMKGRCEDGLVIADRHQRNAQMKSGIGTNCLIDLPAGAESVKKGDTVEILYW